MIRSFLLPLLGQRQDAKVMSGGLPCEETHDNFELKKIPESLFLESLLILQEKPEVLICSGVELAFCCAYALNQEVS